MLSVSDCCNLALDEMQSDYPGLAVVTEVTEDRVLDHRLQVGPVFPSGEDAIAQRPGVIAALHGYCAFLMICSLLAQL